MNNYTNFSDQPHVVKIFLKSNNKLFFEKRCKTESDAVKYLYEARNFKKNKNKFSFRIEGPNLILYEN